MLICRNSEGVHGQRKKKWDKSCIKAQKEREANDALKHKPLVCS